MAGEGPLPRAGGLTRVPAPLLRAGTVAAALFMFMIAAIGASAALGGGDAVNDVLNALHLPSPIGGDEHGDDEGVELRGRVISVSQFGLGLRSEGDFLIVWYSDGTEVRGRRRRADLPRRHGAGDGRLVRATPGTGRTTSTLSWCAWPTAMRRQRRPRSRSRRRRRSLSRRPTPKPEEPAPPPEETPIVAWKEVAFEGKIKAVTAGSFDLYSDGVMRTFLMDGETVVEGSLALYVWAHVSGLESSEGTFVARHVKASPLEFWATVVSVSSSSLTVKVEGSGPNVVVHTGGAGFCGQPFAGVKVWVTAYKKADGSYQALHVTVKTAEIYGAVTAKSGSTYTVTRKAPTLR